MIKNIIFDLSEVIISGYYGIEQLVKKKYNIKIKEFEERKKETLEIFFELMRGKIKEEDYWKKFLEGTDWNFTIEDLKISMRENLNRPVEGTMEIVKELKGKYQLILLSDHVIGWMEYIQERNQDIKIFDKVILSYKIGSLKSDETTFMDVVRQTNIVPDETIFIDDNELNIKKAEEVGIHGIVFKNAKQLKEELEIKYQIQV